MGEQCDNIFVGNVPTHYTEQELTSLFRPYGPIVSTFLCTDPRTGASRHAGFVRFQSPGDAYNAIGGVNGVIPPGGDRQLVVKFAETAANRGIGRMTRQAYKSQSGPPKLRPSMVSAEPVIPLMIQLPISLVPDPSANLHVFHLHPLIDELFLYKAFAHFGAIASIKVIRDLITGEARGYGFVQFYNSGDAHKSLVALNGMEVGGKRWRITIHNKVGRS